MDTTEVTPLRVLEKEAELYVNASGDAKQIQMWVATHHAEGAIHAGPANTPGHMIKPAHGTVFLKISVEANESIRAVPGKDGIVAVRIVQVDS
jgi:hypothetical protein